MCYDPQTCGCGAHCPPLRDGSKRRRLLASPPHSIPAHDKWITDADATQTGTHTYSHINVHPYILTYSHTHKVTHIRTYVHTVALCVARSKQHGTHVLRQCCAFPTFLRSSSRYDFNTLVTELPQELVNTLKENRQLNPKTLLSYPRTVIPVAVSRSGVDVVMDKRPVLSSVTSVVSGSLSLLLPSADTQTETFPHARRLWWKICQSLCRPMQEEQMDSRWMLEVEEHERCSSRAY